MGYADSLLTDGEYIVYRTRQHPLARLFGSTVGIALVAIGIALTVLFVWFGWPKDGLGQLLGWAVLACLLIGAALIAWSYIVWYNEDYLITSRRVIKLSGILNKKATDSSLEKINDAVLEQSLLGRMFDWGNLQILTASDILDVDYHMLHHALEFKKVMLMTKHDLEEGTDRRVDIQRPAPEPALAPPPVALAPAPPPPSIAPPTPAAPTTEEKLRSLAKLRDEGLITPEDYEVKKGDLLDQL